MKRLRFTACALFPVATLAAIVQCSGGMTAVGTDTCVALATCCISNSFPLAERPLCTAVAGDGVDEACQSSLGAYATASYCGGAAFGADAGFAGSSGPVISSGSGSFTDAALPGTGSGTGTAGSIGPGSGTGTGGTSGTAGSTGPGSGSGTGGSCPAFCAVDTDCGSICPAQVDVTYCCDMATHACYETSTLTCPESSTDAGTDSGSMY
jgi:hypothetical protein